MDFDEYQQKAGSTDQNPRPISDTAPNSADPARGEVIPLLGLVGEVGSLLGEYKKLIRDGATHRKFQEEVAEELGDILWYVANVATKFGLRLTEIAEKNLEKVRNRWANPKGHRKLYDTDLPEDQRLPRNFEFSFDQRMIDGVEKMVLTDRLLAETAGDPLTDNASEDDGYRFHDVLHLAFAACLGWSPVVRKLYRRKGRMKNRMPREFSDVEDGGRAQVIEEAIVAAAYVYAVDHAFLDGVNAIDWQLLSHIKRMTSHVEVRDRTEWEWNATLLRGFAVWRQLRANKGGIVRGDLEADTLEFVSGPAV
jgi:NTP pyrophosphatase (non-canonical NTP hydrolase)